MYLVFIEVSLMLALMEFFTPKHPKAYSYYNGATGKSKRDQESLFEVNQ